MTDFEFTLSLVVIAIVGIALLWNIGGRRDE
jgi:hypothetical protein